MTQEAIALRTSGDSYPGIAVVQDVNKALATIATDFAGPDDPAALAGPYMTWADTGSSLLKRRNGADSEWVTIGPLLVEMATKEGDATQTFKAAPSIEGSDAVVRSEFTDGRVDTAAVHMTPLPGGYVSIQATALVATNSAGGGTIAYPVTFKTAPKPICVVSSDYRNGVSVIEAEQAVSSFGLRLGDNVAMSVLINYMVTGEVA